MSAKRKGGLRSVINERAGAAERLSNIMGSIWFLVAFLSFVIFYIVWNNGYIRDWRIFDPSPFNIMDTILSVFAIVLSVSVLVSQNRMRREEKVREQVEFEINVKAEHEITKILEMLQEIRQKLGIDRPDRELEEMKEETDIAELHQKIKGKS